MNEGSRYSLGDLIKYFIKLGFIGFGGSIAPVGAMHRDLVENERWISEEEYKEGLALSQLAPGPLASQLAIYIGYVNYKFIGAALAGLAFVLPSFVIVVFIGWAYVHYNGLPWIHAVFYGVGSAVIGIIAVSSYKLAVKNISKDWLMVIIFSVSSFFTFYLEEENILIIICSGLIFMFLRSPLKFDKKRLFFFAHLGSGFGSITVNSKLLKLGCFFAKAGTLVFGSVLAVVPFLYGGIVKENHWLTEQQFLDAVAVAMITSGPFVITVGFIGYLIQGLNGALVAALATFLPCYLFTILPPPYFKKYEKKLR